ncbi:MAG: hypothetical protein L0I10_09655 [Bifidobacterium crudilactis]|nr:hypothetical protein [Bifidobacterium crudilactis]MDN6458229.1 hypothetical protein [Bifidobacterium crudilactis]MDN6468130.1 hypothetical protein [Bifidobacterium crudilactis]MDN6521735.1 hypothetical protein [Bifidobacterium crudilactis]
MTATRMMLTLPMAFSPSPLLDVAAHRAAKMTMAKTAIIRLIHLTYPSTCMMPAVSWGFTGLAESSLATIGVGMFIHIVAKVLTAPPTASDMSPAMMLNIPLTSLPIAVAAMFNGLMVDATSPILSSQSISRSPSIRRNR